MLLWDNQLSSMLTISTVGQKSERIKMQLFPEGVFKEQQCFARNETGRIMTKKTFTHMSIIHSSTKLFHSSKMSQTYPLKIWKSSSVLRFFFVRDASKEILGKTGKN
jgi:hypothetical protein